MPNLQPPALIVIGGFPGTGKSTVSKNLSRDLRYPLISCDRIGKIIQHSEGFKGNTGNPQFIGYDVVFQLCNDFLESSVSVVLDMTLGWRFQWDKIEEILTKEPQTVFVPIVLRCRRETCLERIQQRYEANPTYHEPAKYFEETSKVLALWEYLSSLQRPEIIFVDTERPFENVYSEVIEVVKSRLKDVT